MALSTFAAIALLQSIALSAIMAAAWFIHRRTGNSGWVDTVWTFGLGIVGACAALAPLSDTSPTQRQLLVALLVLVWSLRLGFNIAQRTAGIADDPRYAQLIRQWGAEAPRERLWLLQKQALVTIPLAISIFIAAQNLAPEFRL
jgi:steroid 5-alpha reductase family enzyme